MFVLTTVQTTLGLAMLAVIFGLVIYAARVG